MAKLNESIQKSPSVSALDPGVEGDTSSALAAMLDLVGLNTDSEGTRSLMVKPCGAAMSEAHGVPLALLAVGKQAQLQGHFLERGYLALVNQAAPRELSSLLLQAAQDCKVMAVDREGLQEFGAAGHSRLAMVKNGESHWFNGKPAGGSTVLVGAAAAKSTSEQSLEDFNKAFAQVLAHNGRLLVVLCFALAAMFARLFNVPHLNLALIGLSSRGKSIAQHFAACVVNGRDEVLTMNATVIGLNEYMVDHPDQAVYFEDAHGSLAAAPLIQGIMDAGNSGGRLRSKRGAGASALQAVHCSMIFSAERGVIETARADRKAINSGIFARLLEIHMGPYGMFDDLCQFADGAELAKHVKAKSPRFMGIVGDTLLRHVAADWKKAKNFWRNKEAAVRGKVLEASEVSEVDGLNSRLLDGLTFAAFVGCFLAQYKIVSIKHSDVYRAFGLVFKEHMNRLRAASSPVASAVIEAVRHFIQTNPGRFLPLAQAADATKLNGMSGYLKRGADGQDLYLFFPMAFREKFDDFGAEAFGHLRDAGYLVVQKSRHNQVSVRVKTGDVGPGQRQDFVAIRSSILYSEGAD